MLKLFKNICFLLCILSISVGTSFASTSRIQLSYSGSGVVSFQEPFDIASYEVFYGENLNLDGQVFLGDLSQCPTNLGLFCIAKNISRSGNMVYLNLKESMIDTVFAIRYKNMDGEQSAPSNLIDVKKQVKSLDISAFSDSKYLYFEVLNPKNLNLTKFSFEIFHDGQNVDTQDPRNFGGCRNYVYVQQSKCAAQKLESIGENIFRVELKENFKNNYRFVISYNDSHSKEPIYSNIVYLKNSNQNKLDKISKIENLKVNDDREIFFDLKPQANKYFVSYSKDYPGYTPKLSDMQQCVMESVDSKCSIQQAYVRNSRMYLKVRPDLDAAFFVVYYEDFMGRISPISRPVYVKNAFLEDDMFRGNALELKQTALDEISFASTPNAKKYFLVHTYGDKVGFLYHSDFPGCKYSGLNCAGYNIRQVFDRYFIKIRPEKTGNRFAVFYEDFAGNISTLSNSVFIPRANYLDSSKLTDINFTEYFQAISDLHARGIVEGYADNTFRPYKKINRAEFLKIAIESYFPEINMYNPNFRCFNDVDINDWFNKYVCFAKQNGIISGYSDGSFRPMQNITLAEALKVSLGSSGFNYFQSLDLNEPWYSEYINAARVNGLLPLSIINKDSQYLINRGEMAYITYKILNN